MMLRFLKTAITSRDNASVCVGRLMGIAAFMVLFGCQIAAVIKGVAFDPVSFATGTSAILSAIGLNIRLKQDDEPDTDRHRGTEDH